VSDHLYLYIQPDLNAAPADGDFAVQLRDIYADISIDHDKEFRFRVGQSKVPFGFCNMQSSQNRLAMERPDALNSAVEGERDIGLYFYWAPSHIRDRFKTLVSKGLKGSGDYGVIGLGAYSGQGLNRRDLNTEFHYVARVSWPFELPFDQILELGVQGYAGRYVPKNGPVPGLTSGTVTPTFQSLGIEDQRVAVSAVLYPQPFGIEAEWTFGRGPALSNDRKKITSDTLQGGYVQVCYRQETDAGVFVPFVRWQYFDGARKFARNAPQVKVNEIDGGLEYSPLKELEVSVVYTYTVRRTDSNTAPYADLTDAHRVAFQLQFNF
jgi:hypothetical protein